MNPTFESHRFLKTSVFQNVEDQSGIGQHLSALTECKIVANLTLKKNCGNVSLV